MPNTPRNLPIDAHRDEIVGTILGNQVTVIHGETGSGKSTQIPRFCLAMDRGTTGLIGHTQPRRVAARGVATRIAAELGEGLGHTVGYRIRFTARTGPDTRIKLMTDGILLAEIQGDRNLRAYDTLIIDEAHERSLDIDFILGYLKKLLPRRPDLKLILASATIDPERFSHHFDDAPIITVSGRTFPVEVRYRPLASEGNGEKNTPDHESDRNPTSTTTGNRNPGAMTIPDAVAEAIEEIYRETRKSHSEASHPRESAPRESTPGESVHGGAIPHDILVFLSGEQEIRETTETLQRRRLPNTEILPLFGRLSSTSQDRIFAPHTRRHIVLSTNIAETSLTVPGIGFVIDAGYARISRYSYRSKVQRLPVEPISRASADQRKGRCGRVAPGICIRLYSREEFEARPEFTEPEILRTNLATVILRMKALGFGDVERFPFLDTPDRRYISDGYRLLRELGAMDEDRLTKKGRQLARLPVDPRIGCMILAGAREHCLDEILIIASALSIPDPREYPFDPAKGTRDAAIKARERFQDSRSDFMELLRIWEYYREKARRISASQLRKRCRKYFLSYLRMREWQEVHQQLRLQAREMKLPTGGEPATYARIHRALLAGLLGHIGFSTLDQEYTGARNSRFLIGRESTLHGSRPKWVMAAELVRTFRTYAHNVARIRPEWIERVGRKLVKVDHFDSRWDEARREVLIRERVTLYGLTIIPGREIPYASINPGEARRLFIEAALVEGCYASDNDAGNTVGNRAGDNKIGGHGVSNGAFFINNRMLVGELREWEHRSRQPGAFVDERALEQFYDERIPEQVAGGRAFEAWRRQVERTDPKHLFLTPEYLCDRQALARVRQWFPDQLLIQDQHLCLDYQFKPGDRSDDTMDGITVTIVQNALYQLRPGPFQWLVPGLLQEKILALLRTLPKPLRRALPPLADTARACFLETTFGRMTDSEHPTPPTGTPLVYPEESLLAVLGESLRRVTGITIPPNTWREKHLPHHLRINFRIIDNQGSTLRAGRDLEQIQRELAPKTSPILPRLSHHRGEDHKQGHSDFHRDGITEWDFPDLPSSVEVTAHGTRFRVYPAIIDRGESVSLRLVDSPARAEEQTRAGLCRLLGLGLRREMRYLRKNLPNLQRLCIAYATLPAQSDESAPGLGQEIDPETSKTIGACDELREHLITLIVARTFLDDKASIRSRAAFQTAKEQHLGKLMTVANTICKMVEEALMEYRTIVSLRAAINPRPFSDSLADITLQLNRLLFRGFLRTTPIHQLPHFPRYLRAIARRLQKLPHSLDKDRQNMRQLIPLQRTYAALAATSAGHDIRDLQRLRWLLEELRVSLFAQELGTTQPVSTKRLQRQFERFGG
uniref:ATP-dependent helicase HrpA n=1 Tax=Candidatus Kentrum sp. LFY TaxID=2126342 RepID=A0A450UGN0_9GAMM|nr:MAG: ATP-dependent helicase HrpA [Candidatus Kentron sp. LFY]